MPYGKKRTVNQLKHWFRSEWGQLAILVFAPARWTFHISGSLFRTVRIYGIFFDAGRSGCC